jgi:hypothetical protein
MTNNDDQFGRWHPLWSRGFYIAQCLLWFLISLISRLLRCLHKFILLDIIEERKWWGANVSVSSYRGLSGEDEEEKNWNHHLQQPWRAQAVRGLCIATWVLKWKIKKQIWASGQSEHMRKRWRCVGEVNRWVTFNDHRLEEKNVIISCYKNRSRKCKRGKWWCGIAACQEK